MQRNYKSASKESSFTSQKELSDGQLSMEASLFPAMETRDIFFAPNYFVTSEGKIFSKNHKRSGYCKEIYQGPDKKGYLRSVLCVNGKCKTYLVHRLIALAFIPNPKNLPLINHINLKPWDNSVSNLEWCNHSYNLLYSYKYDSENMNTALGEKNGKHKLTLKEVIEIKKSYIPILCTQKMLAEIYNVRAQTISDILRKRTWKHII